MKQLNCTSVIATIFFPVIYCFENEWSFHLCPVSANDLSKEKEKWEKLCWLKIRAVSLFLALWNVDPIIGAGDPPIAHEKCQSSYLFEKTSRYHWHWPFQSNMSIESVIWYWRPCNFQMHGSGKLRLVLIWRRYGPMDGWTELKIFRVTTEHSPICGFLMSWRSAITDVDTERFPLMLFFMQRPTWVTKVNATFTFVISS